MHGLTPLCLQLPFVFFSFLAEASLFLAFLLDTSLSSFLAFFNNFL